MQIKNKMTNENEFMQEEATEYTNKMADEYIKQIQNEEERKTKTKGGEKMKKYKITIELESDEILPESLEAECEKLSEEFVECESVSSVKVLWEEEQIKHEKQIPKCEICGRNLIEDGKDLRATSDILCHHCEDMTQEYKEDFENGNQ